MSKKILVISDHRGGGAGHVATQSGLLFSDQGYNVDYIFGDDYFKFNAVGYCCNYSAIDIIRKKLAISKPEIILIHNFDHLWSPFFLVEINKYKEKTGAKVIMTVHDYHIVSASNSLSYYENTEKKFFKDPPSFKQLVTKKLDRRSYIYGLARLVQWYPYYSVLNLQKTFDHFMCPSEFIYKQVVKRFDPSIVSVVHNPTSATISSCQLDNDDVVITFAGRLSKDKGIYDFIKSIADSKLVSPKHITINIIGKGPYFDDIERLVDTLKEQNITIVLHGLQKFEIVKSIFENSSYVLLPSLCYENAPLTLVEGVFAGCKVLTMNYGGMVEIADKLNLSILMDDFSPKSIQFVFDNLNTKKEEQSTLDKFYQDYSNDNYISKVKEIIS
ncbi:Glycosyl transferases group 1 [Photobacterium piscicola]|uniref:Glycosyl transferases group 1 n=1 Tax=Photobacterium piscicola TaxID=1378299 RepID=A0A1T5HZC2_9GAMM|nr:glycosyltransferase [Photobacterium piscicola]SKC32211.1 Glycosyl transferases group 1 [Photobacterium piscicola]